MGIFDKLLQEWEAKSAKRLYASGIEQDHIEELRAAIAEARAESFSSPYNLGTRMAAANYHRGVSAVLSRLLGDHRTDASANTSPDIEKNKAAAAGRKVEPSSETPANRPLDREYDRIAAFIVTSVADAAFRPLGPAAASLSWSEWEEILEGRRKKLRAVLEAF